MYLSGITIAHHDTKHPMLIKNRTTNHVHSRTIQFPILIPSIPVPPTLLVDGNLGPCQGDSGGPVVVTLADGSLAVAGVVPGAFLRRSFAVYFFIPIIDSIFVLRHLK